MEFGPINLWNFVIVTIMLIPNIIYALKNPNKKESCLQDSPPTAGRFSDIFLSAVVRSLAERFLFNREVRRTFLLNQKNSCTNKCMNILEQIGRYACIILMILPLCFDQMKFGFSSFSIFLIYGIGNVVLLLAYLLIWVMYSNERHTWRAISLAVIPTCIFLLTGLTLEHWLLVGAAVIFGTSHIYITQKNNR